MPRLAPVLAAALLLSCTRSLPEWEGPIRGVAFDPFQAQPFQADFNAIAATGASHVSLFVWATMVSHTTPNILRFDRGEGPFSDWSLTDEGFAAMARMARRAGLRLIVVPTFADFVDGHWRGEARMESERDWTEFFTNYREFILHYAQLAEQHQAVGFSVGTELRETVHREREWRELIAEVRGVFNGWITYAANWDDYADLPWWDAVDRVGVQAYFELTNGEQGAGSGERDVATALSEAWLPIRDSLRALSERVDRPIFFSEIGYKSHTGATDQPWDWVLSGEPDTLLQKLAYEAAFDVFSHEPWFDGFTWWKWHPAADTVDRTRDFSPQGKPAERVLRERWGRE